MKVFEKAKVSVNGERVNEETEHSIQLQMLDEQMEKIKAGDIVVETALK